MIERGVRVGALALALSMVMLSAGPTAGQEDAGGDVERAVEPRPEDVETLEGIVAAFYEVISGPAGQPRQWDRDATLYLPGITFTVMGRDPETGDPRPRTIPKAAFIEQSDPFLVQSGFHEREIHRVTTRYGAVAHVWSSYEWETEDGRTGRGVNGIHLAWDGARWWISHATWDQESPDNPIPEQFLPG
jgi:hypothetical protein